jgi:hypothetical protein
MKTLTTLTTLISATLIFVSLYLCLTLGNELLRSIGKAEQAIKKHNNYITEVGK